MGGDRGHNNPTPAHPSPVTGTPGGGQGLGIGPSLSFERRQGLGLSLTPLAPIVRGGGPPGGSDLAVPATAATTTNSSPQPVLTGSLLGRAVRQQQGSGQAVGAPLHSSALLMGNSQQGGQGPGSVSAQPLSALQSSPHQRLGDHGNNNNNNNHRELSVQGQGPGRSLSGQTGDSYSHSHHDITIAEAFDESSWDEEDDG